MNSNAYELRLELVKTTKIIIVVDTVVIVVVSGTSHKLYNRKSSFDLRTIAIFV